MFIDILFLLSGALTLGGALGVLASKNVMHACVYLLASLYGVAGLYAVLGADFLAATQLMVYAGGVVVLMLFAIMLTGGDTLKENKFGIAKIPAMGNKGTLFAGVISATVMSLIVIKIFGGMAKTEAFSNIKLPAFESTAEKIGMLLATDHILAFEISAVLLLGALVGAAVISRPSHDE